MFFVDARLSHPLGQLFSQGAGFTKVAPGFAPTHHTVAKGDGPQPDLIARHLGVCRDWTLTTASHRPEESALRRHTLVRIEMIQPFANDANALVLFAHLDSQSPLPGTGQHRL